VNKITTTCITHKFCCSNSATTRSLFVAIVHIPLHAISRQ